MRLAAGAIDLPACSICFRAVVPAARSNGDSNPAISSYRGWGPGRCYGEGSRYSALAQQAEVYSHGLPRPSRPVARYDISAPGDFGIADRCVGRHYQQSGHSGNDLTPPNLRHSITARYPSDQGCKPCLARVSLIPPRSCTGYWRYQKPGFPTLIADQQAP